MHLCTHMYLFQFSLKTIFNVTIFRPAVYVFPIRSHGFSQLFSVLVGQPPTNDPSLESSQQAPYQIRKYTKINKLV